MLLEIFLSLARLTAVAVIIIIAELCTSSICASSQTFYVSSSTGNDDNNGLSKLAPWYSLSKVNGAALRPGDKVLFKRGEEWRGQLIPTSGSTGSPITYGAYGDGSKPLVLGSVSRNHPHDWQHTGGNIWVTNKPVFLDVERRDDFSILPWSLYTEGGARVHKAQFGDDAKGSIKVISGRTGTKPTHIQLYNRGLSIKDGKYYVFVFRAKCSKPFTIHNINLIRASAPWSPYAVVRKQGFKFTTDWVVYSVRFKASQTASDGRITLYLGGSLPPESEFCFQPVEWKRVESLTPEPLSVDVGNIIFNHGRSVGIKKWKQVDLKKQGDYWYNGDTWQVQLYCSQNPAEFYKSIELALNKTIVDQSGKNNIIYENLALRYGAAHGFGGSGTHHIVIRDCDISWIGGGHQFWSSGGVLVRFGNGIEFWGNSHDNLVEGCRIWEIYDAALTNQGKGVNEQSDITYRNNVIWNSEYSYEYWNGQQGSKTHNIRFEHNTCVNAGYGWGHTQRPNPNGCHLMFYSNTSKTDAFFVRENIFYKATENLLRMDNDWTAGLTMDKNCWFQSSGPLFKFLKKSFYPGHFAQYQKHTMQDNSSLVADPKFININKLDFRLSTDSPVRRMFTDRHPIGSLKRLCD